MVPGVLSLHRSWLCMSEMKLESQEVTARDSGEERQSSGDHGGGCALTAWPRGYIALCWACYRDTSNRQMLLSWVGKGVTSFLTWFSRFHLGKVHKGFFPVGTQACVYLLSLRKFSFLWVGGCGRGGAGVLDRMNSARRVRTERKQGVLKIKFHGQRESTCPSIHPFIFSDYCVIGIEATKVNTTGTSSWEILNKYLLNEWFKLVYELYFDYHFLLEDILYFLYDRHYLA